MATGSDLQSSKRGEARLTADVQYARADFDATAYLQALLNRAGSDAVHGGRIEVFINAHYRGSGMLIVPDGVDIVMGSRGVYDVSGADSATAIYVAETTATRIENLRLVGSGRGRQPLNHAGVTPNDVRYAGSGIVFAGVTAGVIKDCRVEGFGGTTGAAPHNGVAGIWLTAGCQDCTVVNNYVRSCRNGINEDNFFHRSPRANKIIGNRVEECRFGIALDSDEDARDTIVDRNSVLSCVHSGIDLNKARHAKITNNYIEGCGAGSGNHGIWEYGSSNIEASDNEIRNNTVVGCGGATSGYQGSGIKSGPNVVRSNIVGNVCRENAGRGVLIIGKSKYWTVAFNRCSRNGMSGFEFLSVSSLSRAEFGEVFSNAAICNSESGLKYSGDVGVVARNNTVREGPCAKGFVPRA